MPCGYGSRVCLVRSGMSVVRTKRSGVLLKRALGCALLAHFASKVWSLQAKCALKIGVRRPSAQLKALPHRFCNLRPSQVHKQGAKPNICALLAHFIFCVGIILVVSVVLFIASYCQTQTSQPSFCQYKQYYSFQINLISPPPRGNRQGINCTGDCSIAERFICGFLLFVKGFLSVVLLFQISDISLIANNLQSYFCEKIHFSLFNFLMQERKVSQRFLF